MFHFIPAWGNDRLARVFGQSSPCYTQECKNEMKEMRIYTWRLDSSSKMKEQLFYARKNNCSTLFSFSCANQHRIMKELRMHSQNHSMRRSRCSEHISREGGNIRFFMFRLTTLYDWIVLTPTGKICKPKPTGPKSPLKFYMLHYRSVRKSGWGKRNTNLMPGHI